MRKQIAIAVAILVAFVLAMVAVPAKANASEPTDCSEQVWNMVQYYEPIIEDQQEIIAAKELQIEEAWEYHWDAESEWQDSIAVLKEKIADLKEDKNYLRDRRDYWKDRYLDLRDQ